MPRLAYVFGLVLAASSLFAACSAEDGATRRPRVGRPVTDASGKDLSIYENPHTKEKQTLPDPLEGLAHGSAQITSLCQRSGSMTAANPNFNAVTNAFCVENRVP